MNIFRRIKTLWLLLFRRSDFQPSSLAYKIHIDPELIAKLKAEKRTTCSAQELSNAISVEDAVKLQCAFFEAYCRSAGNEIEQLVDEDSVLRLNITFHYPFNDQVLSAYSQVISSKREELNKELAKKEQRTKELLENTFTEVDENFEQTLREMRYVEENDLTNSDVHAKRLEEEARIRREERERKIGTQAVINHEEQTKIEEENARKLGLLGEFEGENYEEATQIHSSRVSESYENNRPKSTTSLLSSMPLHLLKMEDFLTSVPDLKARMEKGEPVPLSEIRDRFSPELQQLFVKWIESHPLQG